MLLDLTSPEFWQTLAWPLFVLLLGMGWYPCCCDSAIECGDCCPDFATEVVVEFAGVADTAIGNCGGAFMTGCTAFNSTSFSVPITTFVGSVCTYEIGPNAVPCSTGSDTLEGLRFRVDCSTAAMQLCVVAGDGGCDAVYDFDAGDAADIDTENCDGLFVAVSPTTTSNFTCVFTGSTATVSAPP